jgi:acetyl-CoA carboxylase carboxyl transferase subunit beta
MPLADWFSARESRRYTRVDDTPQASSSAEVPDGVWVKCEGCKHTLYEGELAENDWVCRHCGRHFDLTAAQRVELLTDEGSFTEIDADIEPCDPLGFVAAKSYEVSLDSAREKSGMTEAVITGRATIGGEPVVFGAMDFRFIGASMGSVVGEKVTRAFELATSERLPIVLLTASGGARMQEGMLSLMQMAKTCGALARLAEARLPFISLLTHPTTGGVTASFATIGDINLAEPRCMIGFAGPRVVKETTHQNLPPGFQTAEFMLEHGLIDAIVRRHELRDKLVKLLGFMMPER